MYRDPLAGPVGGLKQVKARLTDYRSTLTFVRRSRNTSASG